MLSLSPICSLLSRHEERLTAHGVNVVSDGVHQSASGPYPLGRDQACRAGLPMPGVASCRTPGCLMQPSWDLAAMVTLAWGWSDSTCLLMPIISHFDRQLLGNKLSITLCSIHILFNSNEFHKFWMSFDFRNKCAKNGRNCFALPIRENIHSRSWVAS